MKVTILVVGKPLTGDALSLQQEYEKRLQQHVSIEWLFVPHEGSGPDDVCRKKESQRIADKLKDNDYVVLLDERGVLLTNQQLADEFVKWQQHTARTVLIIGGAYGVDEHIRGRAQLVWSLSPLVFPHQLVRVMLAEQLYRTQMLINGHPYHHM